ncbi:MAG: sterol desaturase family protein [Saprospiraceae bacterium]|nr:sterol desaturase family protein [Saprospiraceae bacterium]
MIETLAKLQPLILIGLLATMYSLELFIPYLAKPADKRKHDLHNFGVSFISFAVNGPLSGLVVYMLMFTAQHQLGLFNQVGLPVLAEIILGILLIDFGSYCFHNLQHKVPLLWRFHRVHHSDPNLNTSSVLRFHPVDVALSQCIFQVIWIPLMGISMTSFVIYGGVALPLLVLQHANVCFPEWVEKYGRFIFSTPGWHKIHHSDEQHYTDSHYGDVFTFWDRIFGTHHKVSPEQISYGLKEFKAQKHHTIKGQLWMPFENGPVAATGNNKGNAS